MLLGRPTGYYFYGGGGEGGGGVGSHYIDLTKYSICIFIYIEILKSRHFIA